MADERLIAEAFKRGLISEDEAKQRLATFDAEQQGEAPTIKPLKQAQAETRESQQRRQAAVQERRAEGTALGRVGEAAFGGFAEPATEFTGLREQFTRSPSETLNQLNSIILSGGEKAVDALRALETIVLSPVRAGVQAVGEIRGEDPREIAETRREVQEAVDVGLLPLAAKPSTFRTTRGRVAPDEGAKQRIAEERGLPEEVPLTRGDITQAESAQAFEEAAATGVKGPQAQAIIQGRRDVQAEALQANVEAQQRALSGRERPLVQAERGRGAQAAAGELQDIAKTDRKAISDAYDIARETTASVEPKLVGDFSDDMRAVLGENFDIELMTDLDKNLSDLKGFGLEADGKLTSNTLNRLQALRKRISNTQQKFKVSDPPQAEASRQLKNSLDDFLGELAEQGAIKGDATAQKAWSDAIGLRRDFGKRFETNKIIEDIVRPRTADEALTQEEVMDKLLGASKMGFKKESGKVVRDLKKILGPDSEGFKALKEEAFLKLFRNQPETGFSGQKFETSWKNMKSDNPTLIRSLYSKEEIADIDRLVSVAQNVTKRLKGIENPSRSATVFAKIVQSGAFSGPLGSIVQAAVKPVREARAAGRAERAINIMDKIAEVRPKNDLFLRAVILSQEEK